MEALIHGCRQVTAWLEARGIGPQEIQAIALLLAVFSILLSLWALRRASRIGGLPGLHSIGDKVERGAVQLSDLKHSWSTEREKLLEELRTLAEKVRRLEGEVPPPPEKKSPKSAPVPLKTPPSADADEHSIRSGVEKTRVHFLSRLTGLLRGKGGLSREQMGELEELLISSDIGVHTTQKLLADLERELAAVRSISENDLKLLLRKRMYQILTDPPSSEIPAARRGEDPLVILVVGVNGVGKTTTIGKLSHRFAQHGAKVLLGAADTFRAAAGEQIEIWAERAGVTVLRGADGAKPSTVAFEAVQRARNEGFDVVIIDTAGRLHTRVNLMNELGGVLSVIGKECPGAPHEVLLVVDATTGQNALEQAKEFNARAGLTGVVLTKLDGTPKGGIILAIQDALHVPIRYVGVGESMGDLKPFSADEFLDALFDEGEGSRVFEASEGKAAQRAVRRRPVG